MGRRSLSLSLSFSFSHSLSLTLSHSRSLSLAKMSRNTASFNRATKHPYLSLQQITKREDAWDVVLSLSLFLALTLTEALALSLSLSLSLSRKDVAQHSVFQSCDQTSLLISPAIHEQ